MTTDPRDRPHPDTHEDPLPDLIDFWPKWEKNCYLMTQAASDMVESTVTACQGCREGQYCSEHVEASDPELRCDLERQLMIWFCAGEITCASCADGSDCQSHWRQGVRHVLAGIFPTVLEVAEASGARFFPHYAGYGLSKGRKAVLCWGTYVQYMSGARVKDKYELMIGDLPRETSKMREWLDG